MSNEGVKLKERLETTKLYFVEPSKKRVMKVVHE
jgi:hypothetical protein